VKRTTAFFAIQHIELFKKQMLSWANRFNICCFLDNHQYHTPHHHVECLLAVDAIASYTAGENAMNALRRFDAATSDWLFGHVSYDFKDHIHHTPLSKHIDGIGFPKAFFFQPETVIELRADDISISCIHLDPADVFDEIQSITIASANSTNSINIQPRISKQTYLDDIRSLQQHILKGDCYEINYCQEFYAEDVSIDPLQVYEQLTAVSPNPFASFYKVNDLYLLCASPERYLQRQGNQLLSQPIKGTHKRNLQNAQEDALLKQELMNSAKDRSENVMIVDLVRNDMSRVCKPGSVAAKELFEIYAFPQVYQMISTITGELSDDIDFTTILEATFPMGSMTGAPKKRVMELTEQYEHTQRGIYSGCVGYITPEKNFDFNVVIRSIMYDQSKGYLSYQVGGGITFYSDAEKEYEECLLKAAAIKKVLQ